ncbi:hypothetical protein [Streptomyces platensis]|uniref:hypothetical protein n=1 Tax=Streptomyces platensis TaxID=58346 RepID=UPI00369B78B8
MTRSADIDFTFQDPVDPSAVMRRLLEAGASIDYDGRLSYVLDQDGMFDWKRVEIEKLGDVLECASKSPPERTTLGFSIILDEVNTGGDLLFHPDRRNLSFLITINRKNLPHGSKFCDFGWYLERLTPIFESMGLTEIELCDMS